LRADEPIRKTIWVIAFPSGTSTAIGPDTFWLCGRSVALGGGKTVLAPTVADRLVHFVREPTSVTLSSREFEVLSQVAKGSTNAEICPLLHISKVTVKTHLLRAVNKLGVSDRTAAVTTAMSMGLVP
jgi:DNA-binding NarL/FixJ family response regulator